MKINTVELADTFERLPEIPDNSFPIILTDPEYFYNEEQKLFLHNQFLRICSGVVIVFAPPENQWIRPVDQYLFWIKPISTKNTSKNYSRFVEMIFIYGRHVWNTHRHWSQYTNVMTDLVENKNHPWEKPVSLIKRLILNHSSENDVIFDPFMGSGTTAVAALSTNRNYFGFENNQEYYQMCENRICNYIGV